MILRELLLKLGLTVDEASFAKGELAAKAAAKGLQVIVDVAKEAAYSILENVKATIEYADKLDETSQSLGIATDALQELQYVASFSSISADEMSQSIGFLSKNMQAAAKGGEEQAEAFQKLGVRVKDSRGQLRGADEVLGDLADAFQKLPDGAEKTALSMQLFGRAGKNMIPLLNAGRQGLADLRQEARDLGLVLDEEFIKVGAETADTIDRIRAVTVGLWRSAIGPLLPSIRDLLKQFLAWEKANAALIKQQIQKYLGAVVEAIKLTAAAFKLLVDNGEAVVLILKGMTVAYVALHAAGVAAAVATAASWAAAAAPFVALGAVIAGILLFLDDVRVYKKGLEDPNFKGKSVFGLWANTIAEWQKPNANDPWWLRAIKDLVLYMEKALGIADKLGLSASARAEVEKQEANKPSFMSRVLGTSGSAEPTGEPTFMARLFGTASVPEARASRDRVVMSPSLTVQMSFTGHETPNEVSDVLEQRLNRWWDGKMEAAGAALER